jgi:hypothetical protein
LLINHITAIYFACLSIYLADSNLSAHYSSFSPPPLWLSSIRLVFCVYSCYFGWHLLRHASTGDHAICSHACILWHYLIPFLSHSHLLYNLFSTYVPFSGPGHVDLSGHVVCGSNRSPQVLPVLSVTDFDSVYGCDSDINVNSDSCFDVKFDLKLPITSPLVHSDSDLCSAFDSCDVWLHDYLLDVCNNNKFPHYCNDSGSKFSEFVHNITSLYPNICIHVLLYHALSLL